MAARSLIVGALTLVILCAIPAPLAGQRRDLPEDSELIGNTVVAVGLTTLAIPAISGRLLRRLSPLPLVAGLELTRSGALLELQLRGRNPGVRRGSPLNVLSVGLLLWPATAHAAQRDISPGTALYVGTASQVWPTRSLPVLMEAGIGAIWQIQGMEELGGFTPIIRGSLGIRI